jgi:mRNA-degrading endonuclease RelE of RelBE toxin-antitoxin system
MQVTFIESPLFTKYVYDYLNDDEYASFQSYLAHNPEKGDLIRGGGGLRKIRCAAKGKGKSGGARVIYYYIKNSEIRLVMIYPKNELENISEQTLKILRKELPND